MKAGHKPTGPRGGLFFGSLQDFRHRPLELLSEARRDHGDVVRLSLAGTELYVFFHPDHVQHIMQSRVRNYPKGTNLGEMFGTGLFTSNGDLWKRQRTLMQPSFRPPNVAALFTAMRASIDSRLEHWKSFPVEGLQKDFEHEIAQVTLEVAGRTLMGSDVRETNDRLSAATYRAIAHIDRRLFAPIKAPDGFPSPANLRFRRDLATVDGIVFRLIDQALADPRITERTDLLSLLVSARHPETGERMDRRQLRDEVVTLLLAGFETTATTLTWLFDRLAVDPALQSRLRSEVDEALGAQEPTLERMMGMQVTGQVIQETLRLHPPGWCWTRRAIEADEIGGYPIRPGQIVLVAPYVTHRHPEFWEEPDLFDPGRFSPARSSESRHKWAYLPFGGGPRICIGQHFANLEMRLIIALLLRDYEFERIEGKRPVPAPKITLKTRDGLALRIRPRLKRPVS